MARDHPVPASKEEEEEERAARGPLAWPGLVCCLHHVVGGSHHIENIDYLIRIESHMTQPALVATALIGRDSLTLY